jgi:fatty acid desaturase
MWRGGQNKSISSQIEGCSAHQNVVVMSMNTTIDACSASSSGPKQEAAHWKKIVLEFQKPSLPRAVWQLVDTLGPYALIWYLMYLSLAWSYWATFGLAVLNGLFLIRIFIIFHDCGHGSFFKSSRANDAFGFITGLLTLNLRESIHDSGEACQT